MPSLPSSYAEKTPQTYVQAFLSLDAYRHTYTVAIHSPNADKADLNEPNGDNATIAPADYLQDDDDTEENRIIGSHARRQPGRPKVNRIKSEVEGPFGAKRAKRCSRCGGLGHAITTCDATI